MIKLADNNRNLEHKVKRTPTDMLTYLVLLDLMYSYIQVLQSHFINFTSMLLVSEAFQGGTLMAIFKEYLLLTLLTFIFFFNKNGIKPGKGFTYIIFSKL